MAAIHLINRGTEFVYCGIKSANSTIHPATATCKRCDKAYQAELRSNPNYDLQKCDNPGTPAIEATTCECSLYYYTIGAKVHTTACTKAPSGKKSRFAQGHDQKLVSLRKKAAAAGAEVKRWSK